MKRSISQESMNSGRRTPDGVTQRPAFLRSLSIEPDSPGPGTFGDDTAEALLGAGSAVKSYLGLLLFHVEAFFPKSKTCATSLSADQGHHNVVAYTKLPRELFRIAAYNTGQVFVAGQTKLAKEKIKRDKDGYVLDAEGKRVPVVLQYSSFDFLKDKAKAIVEAHATEASKRWDV